MKGESRLTQNALVGSSQQLVGIQDFPFWMTNRFPVTAGMRLLVAALAAGASEEKGV